MFPRVEANFASFQIRLVPSCSGQQASEFVGTIHVNPKINVSQDPIYGFSACCYVLTVLLTGLLTNLIKHHQSHQSKKQLTRTNAPVPRPSDCGKGSASIHSLDGNGTIHICSPPGVGAKGKLDTAGDTARSNAQDAQLKLKRKALTWAVFLESSPKSSMDP